MNKKVALYLMIIFSVSLLIPYITTAETTGGMSITDREIIERLTRLEEGQKNLSQRIDDLRSIMLAGFAVLFAGMFVLVGFVIWDRRTALSPVIRKTKQLEDSGEVVLKALKEYSRKEPKLAEVLRSFNLL